MFNFGDSISMNRIGLIRRLLEDDGGRVPMPEERGSSNRAAAKLSDEEALDSLRCALIFLYGGNICTLDRSLVVALFVFLFKLLPPSHNIWRFLTPV